MQVTVEKLSPVLVEFQVQVPAETVADEVHKAYESLKRTARVRGFRRGKAPRSVLVHLYGRAIHADVARRLVDQSLQRALADKSLQPLTQPDVEPADLDPKSPFSFKARFEVRPDIDKVQWEGLDATRKATGVTEEAVGKEIERLRTEHAVEQPIEGRAAAKGDRAALSLRFDLDGEEKSERVDTEIGSGEILKPLEEAVAGMNVGDEKEVDAKLPEQHPDPKLRSKPIHFVLKLEELKERVLPQVDDEFAKDCDHESLEALKKALEGKLEEQQKQQIEEDVARQLVAELCEKNPIPVPPSLVEQQARLSERELVQMARMGGRPFSMSAEMQARIRADAEMKVRAGLLMAEIAKEKQLRVTEDDIEKGYTELAAQTGKNVARVKAEYRDKGKREMLIGMILEDKVLDLLEGAAKITAA